VPRDRPPGIWESLKRALAGVEARPDPPPTPQLPERPDVTPEPAPLLSAPPFLPPEPEDADAIRRSETLPENPPVPPAMSVPPPEGPRLARGLASFSRSNADREKKFAHLLHDDAPGEKKKPSA
jgi:hypothetical protein